MTTLPVCVLTRALTKPSAAWRMLSNACHRVSTAVARGDIALSAFEHAGLIGAFSELCCHLDYFLVDTAAGVSPAVVSFAQACQEVIVVVCDEPAALTDAYGLIKVLSRDHGIERFRVLASMTRSAAEGRELYAKLARVAGRFLDVRLTYLGNIPYDEHLRRAVQQQAAVVEVYPSSFSALAFKKLAVLADNWAVPDSARGNVEFFVERLVGGVPVGNSRMQ